MMNRFYFIGSELCLTFSTSLLMKNNSFGYRVYNRA